MAKFPLDKDRNGNNFFDMSDRYTEKRSDGTRGGHVIEFYSIPTGESVSFKAFLTEFQDSYTSEWNDENSFGRMDPIHTFKRTSRKISLGWDVPAASVNEAKQNLFNAEKLLSMLYPVYETKQFGTAAKGKSASVDSVTLTGATPRMQEEVERAAKEALLRSQRNATGGGSRKVGVMVAAPLLKLKFANLIMENGDAAKIAGTAENSGLVGTLGGLTYSPDIDQGFFGSTTLDQVEPGTLIPQTIKFSCEFTVMHTSPLGYDVAGKKGENKRSKYFPYHQGETSKS